MLDTSFFGAVVEAVFNFHITGLSDTIGVQGDPYGRGKDYVDIKFKVPSQAWVAGQPYI